MNASWSQAWGLPAWSLARREVVRFVRQRSRLAGALGTPILFWLLLGCGLGRSFSPPGAPEGQGYLQFFFPGTLAMIVLFSSIFTSYSVIEDRREGFLQGVLASPARRSAVAAGKVGGAAVLAWGQGMVFALLAPLSGLPLSPWNFMLVSSVAALLAVGLAAMGLAVAWWMDSPQGFHAVMNLLLLPMWLLSGAVFPVAGAPLWLAVVMAANPMTYGVSALRWAFGPAAAGGGGPAPGLAIPILAAFSLAAFIWAVATVARPAK